MGIVAEIHAIMFANLDQSYYDWSKLANMCN